MKIEQLLAMHQKDPSDGVALYRLARASFDGQQFADAYRYGEMSAKLNNDAEIQLILAMSAYHLDRHEHALEHAKRALQLEPPISLTPVVRDNPISHSLSKLGLLKRQRAQMLEESQSHDKWIVQSLHWARTVVESAALASNTYETRVKKLDEQLSKTPNSIGLLEQLCREHYRNNDDQLTIAVAQHVLELDGKRYLPHRLLAELFAKASMYDKAYVHVKQSLLLHTDGKSALESDLAELASHDWDDWNVWANGYITWYESDNRLPK
jgi:tetratricopeptide (TPR) repeat protein